MTESETTRLISIIPKDVLRKILSFGDSELEPAEGFLGFEENYRPVAEHVPKDFTIVDLGCYQAAQCYFFRNHKKYIGIDRFDDTMSSANRDYIPPHRFALDNTTHLCMTIRQFAEERLPEMDPERMYFIASAVPDEESVREVWDKVPHMLWAYPGRMPKVKGVGADLIRAEVNAAGHSQDIFANV